jgi:hypothetical protein
VFEGAFDGTGPVTLVAGGSTLTVRRAGTGFAGEFVPPGGAALPFTATLPAEGPGLLDAESRDTSTGAIIRDGNVIGPDGQRGHDVRHGVHVAQR